VNEIDVELWRLFVQIANHGSLTKVASARGVAQSVISRQLATIERICGGYLFDRTGRGVRLNEAGQRIYPRVTAWLDEGGRLTRDVRSAVAAPSGIVRVGILESMDPGLSGTLYDEVSRRFPEIRLRLSLGIARQVSLWVDEGTVDIGLSIRNTTDSRRGDLVVATHRSVLIGRPGDPVTSAEVVRFRRLDGLPLVLGSAPSAWRDMLEHLAHKKGIRIVVAAECDSIEIQKHLVAHHGLYAIQGAHAVRPEEIGTSLRAARIVSPEILRPLVVSVPENRPPNAACRAVHDLLVRMIESRSYGFV
jgi:DNA-binding transcriptional LysR family regulator